MGIFNPFSNIKTLPTRFIQAKTYINGQEDFLAGVGPDQGQPVMR